MDSVFYSESHNGVPGGMKLNLVATVAVAVVGVKNRRIGVG